MSVDLFAESYDESQEDEALAPTDAIAVLMDGDDNMVGELRIQNPDQEIMLEYGTEAIVISTADFQGKTVAELFEQFAPHLGMTYDPARINFRTGTDFIPPEMPVQAGQTYTSGISHDGKGR